MITPIGTVKIMNLKAFCPSFLFALSGCFGNSLISKSSNGSARNCPGSALVVQRPFLAKISTGMKGQVMEKNLVKTKTTKFRRK